MGAHTIFVRNMSGKPQEFEVHGWNNNKNITVKAHSEVKISAPDGSSGAIIALHDGHEGEQAEITKNGFGGNDFFDVSVIVGAGGNMVVQQVGDAKTRKGDAHFMQSLNTAWSKASQDTKNKLKNCVHVSNGKVVRIDAPKNFPELEKFVRTFADGKAYIGVGAWNGQLGNANDNNQSSAGHGNKDILVCYSDGDATPNDGFHAQSLAAESVPSETVLVTDSVPAPEDKKEPIVTVSEASPLDLNAPTDLPTINLASVEMPALNARAVSAEPGIQLTNKSKKECTYYFYDNYWNGNGTAGANFDHPLKHVALKPGASQFVALPATFKGRVQRGTQLPATWAEFQLDASNDHAAHGDISLQQGCDGAATIASTDGSNRINGLGADLADVVAKAPEAAIRKKPNGERAIDTTVGNWNGGPNRAAIDYLNRVVGQKRAYIVGGTGVPDVASKNRRLAVVMY
ncbi:hypothetical protein CONLIGDRAFT_670899 [Coniochaeta ligniaria NRRL 30616]|uniref:Uncharacterized protein n=1 Tax=Coniochaeta ligniaria NRRL 30616 TaxID=1408157 RepID=A0A1J7J7H6_9PEZI|nr:hypothetical protein CONLIGDRAFT_670899 [Coniochaeta ligniaria NRRL 30616]